MRFATDVRHGSYQRYRTGCRCDLCRHAWSLVNKRSQERRAERLAKGTTLQKHGTAKMYKAYGCRCDACIEAHSIASRAAYAKKKDAR